MTQSTANWITALLLVAIALFIMDISKGRKQRGYVALSLLVAFVALLYLVTGYPFPVERVSFGASISEFWAVGAMCAGIILGMAAQYLWSKPTNFSWLDFIRPLVISPLVLLPLIGSLAGSVEAMQLISLALLAFQNGFFWQQVLKDAIPKTA